MFVDLSEVISAQREAYGREAERWRGNYKFNYRFSNWKFVADIQ